MPWHANGQPSPTISRRPAASADSTMVVIRLKRPCGRNFPRLSAAWQSRISAYEEIVRPVLASARVDFRHWVISVKVIARPTRPPSQEKYEECRTRPEGDDHHWRCDGGARARRSCRHLGCHCCRPPWRQYVNYGRGHDAGLPVRGEEPR